MKYENMKCKEKICFLRSNNSHIYLCPGFSQDRVNFHQKSGGDPARWTDPTWPNGTGYSIPCAIMLGSGWEGAGQQAVRAAL